MGWAAYLLHSGAYGKVDETLGDADVYFSIMDYQEILPKGDCEGCYFAVGSLPSGCHGYKYNAIAQTFSSHSHGLGEQGCFAIRGSGCDGNLRDVVKEFRIIPEEHESSVISSVPVILVYVRLEPAFCKIIPSVFQRGAVIIDHPLSDFRQK